jgi:hypothetical protein
VNEQLLEGILTDRKSVLKSVALIDATDLQASATDQKKRESTRLVGSQSHPGSSLAQGWLHSIFCRLQKTYPPPVVT